MRGRAGQSREGPLRSVELGCRTGVRVCKAAYQPDRKVLIPITRARGGLSGAGTHFRQQVTLWGVPGSGQFGRSEVRRHNRREGMWGFPGQGKRDAAGCKEEEGRERNGDLRTAMMMATGGQKGAFRGGNRTAGESLTCTSGEKPVCTEPSKMEFRVVPT